MDTHIETVTRPLSPLEELQGHFKQTNRRQIKCDLVSVPLYVAPLTAEDFLFAQEAQKMDAKKQVRQFALLIVSKVKTEDGALAFRSRKGAQAAAEELVTSISPTVFFDLFGEVFDASTDKEIEELGNGLQQSASAG